MALRLLTPAALFLICSAMSTAPSMLQADASVHEAMSHSSDTSEVAKATIAKSVEAAAKALSDARAARLFAAAKLNVSAVEKDNIRKLLKQASEYIHSRRAIITANISKTRKTGTEKCGDMCIAGIVIDVVLYSNAVMGGKVCKPMILLAYWGVGIAVFMVDQGVTFPEALLMMGQLVTTVGYGSHTPSTDGMKIFHAMHALLGSAFVTSQMDNMVDKLVDAWQSVLPPGISQIPLLTISLLGGTFVYAQDFHEGSPGDYPTYESALLDAFYMTIFTLTTVGYGDVSPMTPWGMGLSAPWMITGSRAFARFVATVHGDTPEPAGPLMDWSACS